MAIRFIPPAVFFAGLIWVAKNAELSSFICTLVSNMQHR